MALGPFRSFLAEPRVADAPERVVRDWWLVAVIVVGSTIEAIVRNDVRWPIPSLVVSVFVAFAVLRRRRRPLAMTVLTFAAVDVLSLTMWIDTGRSTGYYSLAALLVVPYCLFRWGSGRDAGIGVAILVVAWVVGITTDPGPIGDAIGGFMVLAFTAALGLMTRYRSTARRRVIDEVKLREREQLARELHDIVAHHVSAIAVQAQAGRAVAAVDPGAALAALAVIEHEASRTLHEMRAMVGALRNGAEAELAPQHGVGDLHQLAQGAGGSLRIDVWVADDVGELSSPVDRAIYRIAQESITNAVRHARNATHVDVRLVTNDEVVRLTVVDDGRAVDHDRRNVDGYGLMGMTERVKLLGGTLHAGPRPGGGWSIDAALPRTGLTS